jgi:hypothetical protein
MEKATITVQGIPSVVSDIQATLLVIVNPLAKLAENLGVKPTDRREKGLPGIFISYDGKNEYDYIEILEEMIKRFPKVKEVV